MKIRSHLFFIFVFVLISLNALQASPKVFSVIPFYGPNTGGTSITIMGSGFTSATAVNFGKNSVVPNIISDSEINVVSPAYSPGTVDIQVVAPSGTSPVTPADRFTFQGPWLLIDTTENSFDIINLQTLILTSFSHSMSIDGGVSITPDGTQAIVSNDQTTNGQIQTLDLTLPSYVLSEIELTGSNVFGVSINPDGTNAYVGSGSSLIGIDLPDTVAPLPVFTFGLALYSALTRDGSKGYVTRESTDVVEVNLETGTSTTFSNTFIEAQGIAISPDENFLIVTDVGDVGNPALIKVFYLKTANPTTTITLVSGAHPGFVAISPNGQLALVSDEILGQIYALDLTTTPVTLSKTFGTLSAPFGIAFDPSGSKAYVANSGSHVISIIDVATLTVEANTIAVSDNSIIVAVTPDQAPVAHFTSSVSNQTVTLDATDSISPTGAIATYSWDFGDGKTLTTSDPVVTHTYAGGGVFTVTLVVTNSAGTSLTQTFTGSVVSNNGGPTAMISEEVIIAASLTNVRGEQIANRFLTQRDFINVLRWDSVSTAPPNAFNIYRDASLTMLAGSVPGNVHEFKDHNRKKGTTYTYYIVAVYPGGIFSAPSFVEVKSLRRKKGR